jgi:hypothetical protein
MGVAIRDVFSKESVLRRGRGKSLDGLRRHVVIDVSLAADESDMELFAAAVVVEIADHRPSDVSFGSGMARSRNAGTAAKAALRPPAALDWQRHLAATVRANNWICDGFVTN